MFTTPNRFLRDRATKALVALLTGRLALAERLVDRFADVDDPYVAERVYAAVYGVAMRSYDTAAVGRLASLVYERVFASGTPPPHILLRDYARGVVERAIHLGEEISITESLIRPPYKSDWPNIPTEDDIEAMVSGWERDEWHDDDLNRARDLIRFSVMSGDLMSGDFARYVIRNESPPNWLAKRLGDPPAQPLAERLAALLSEFSVSECAAYDEFMQVEDAPSPMLDLLVRKRSGTSIDWPAIESAVTLHNKMKSQARRRLMSELTKDHVAELESILQEKSNGPPRIDPREIQRYILWRVFDLGWTIERFGHFDHFTIGWRGRDPNKPERMGKKYQWIAYHEILAYIADRFQYQEQSFNDEGDRQYEGPWQESLRDIDPSLTLKATLGDTTWDPHNPAWWGSEQYDAWDEDASHQKWLAESQEIPKIKRLLEVVNPNDGTCWVNVNGSFVWRQPHPADRGPFDLERRELWIGLTGYFVRTEDAESFMSWAKTVTFWGRWMPEPPETYSIYLGEYGWASAFEHSFSNYSDSEKWVKPTGPIGKECPVALQPASFRYSCGEGGFDCSIDEYIGLHLPSQEFIRHLGLQWSPPSADYVDPSGSVVAFDPTAHEAGPTALLLNKASLEKYLRDKGLTLCWVVLGEKMILGGGFAHKFHGLLKISGAYRLTQTGPKGFVNCDPEFPETSSQPGMG